MPVLVRSTVSWSHLALWCAQAKAALGGRRPPGLSWKGDSEQRLQASPVPTWSSRAGGPLENGARWGCPLPRSAGDSHLAALSFCLPSRFRLADYFFALFPWTRLSIMSRGIAAHPFTSRPLFTRRIFALFVSNCSVRVRRSSSPSPSKAAERSRGPPPGASGSLLHLVLIPAIREVRGSSTPSEVTRSQLPDTAHRPQSGCLSCQRGHTTSRGEKLARNRSCAPCPLTWRKLPGMLSPLPVYAAQAGEGARGDGAARRAAAAVSDAVIDFERAAPGGCRSLVHNVLHKVAR